MQRLFILALTFVVCLGMAIGLTLYLSLIPFFHQIGWAVLGLLFVAIGCTAILAVTFTYTRASIMLSHRNHSRLMARVIMFEQGAAAVDRQGNWIHLSAEHQRAQVALPQTVVQQLPAPAPRVLDEEAAKKEAVIAMAVESGSNLRDIAKEMNVSYYKVQKWVSEHNAKVQAG